MKFPGSKGESFPVGNFQVIRQAVSPWEETKLSGGK